MTRLLPLFALAACTKGQDIVDTAPKEGVAALGYASHDINAVTLEVLGDSADGLNTPRDLGFNPQVPGELWVVNRSDDSTTTFFDVGTASQTSLHIVDPYAEHFMEEVSSISFGQPGTFGTCQESRNTYNNEAPPNNFMGPTLWSSDFDIYGESNPAAVEYLTQLFGFYTDLGSHLDMLHESPLCMGMAWEVDNVYWVFDGFNRTIVRYDFATDHGPGYDDHSDGIIGRYEDAEVARVEDVPSHMVFDHDSSLLYIADTGHNRITVLDTTTGERGSRMTPVEPGTDYHSVEGASYTTLIDGASLNPPMRLPSGIALVEDHLLVSDNGNGVIYAFDLQGNMVDWVDTGLGDARVNGEGDVTQLGGLMGIEAPSLEEIYFVDAVGNQLLRLTP